MEENKKKKRTAGDVIRTLIMIVALGVFCYSGYQLLSIYQKDMGIDDIFAEDVLYTESWCPQYSNRKTVKHWFQEWNTRGKVVVWEIKQFFHKENQTIVEWYFKNGMNNGDIEEFDGISLIEWTEDNKIKSLKEFGCNRNTYNPYQESDTPQFRNQKANWF